MPLMGRPRRQDFRRTIFDTGSSTGPTGVVFLPLDHSD